LTKIDLGAELASYDGAKPHPPQKTPIFDLSDLAELLEGKPACIGTLKDLQAEGFKTIPPHIQAMIDEYKVIDAYTAWPDEKLWWTK
jgi:hypothetical protein